MYPKNTLHMINTFFLAGIVLFFIGCSASTGEPVNHDDHTKEDNMKPMSVRTPLSSDIPPIDADAPAEFETASFGLG
ncbi:MAG: hypothetical protein SWH61_12375 [Thermodesulfobacteriota bacterium]|nr:hypothetical protein [Thermodesulfobacteriota bacterium]